MLKKKFEAKKKQKRQDLQQEEENALSNAEADFNQEEADLLALLGDGDDGYWWEESLTRDIVAETENTSDWDALAQEQKKNQGRNAKKTREERNELQSQILAEENMLVEELK